MAERTARRLDVICIGRVSVDLYGEQVGGPLEAVQSFAKYVGGCPANIAIGTARLGLKSALLSRVGDEQMGCFVRATLEAEGVETSHLVTDPERLTALVILGIRDGRTFPHIFYRENCADMALATADFDKAFVASARAVLVTGTHFSQPGVEAASRQAIAWARESGTRVAFDIDYRPVAWGLAGHAAGESRFVASDAVTKHLQTILPECDLIVGTEEEIHIAGGTTDTRAALAAIRAMSDAAIVLKRGALGCIVFPGAIPERLEDGLVGQGFPVEVFNAIGAGDGFLSGFLRGWLEDEPWETCARYGNACGALVVSRHGCAPAIPTRAELEWFLERGVRGTAEAPERLREDPELARLHRVTTRRRAWPEVCALAFDHRRQLESLAQAAGAEPSRIARFKALVAEGAARAVSGLLEPGAEPLAGAGVIVDGRYGTDVLARMTNAGWWVARPVERPGSRPLEFEADDLALELCAWPADQVAKCLVAYHPDDPAELRATQEVSLRRLQNACIGTGHELLVEVVAPDERPRDAKADATGDARALQRLYDAGIRPDWWKLAPPDAAGWAALAEVLERYDPYCRGILLLGANAAPDALAHGFAAAAGQRWCRGFAVGRSIFQQPAEAWLAGRFDDEGAIAAVAGAYREVIDLWRRRGAE